MSRVITLTTDFGPDSPYVAQMKGVILGIHPAANIVDVTHSIRPQNVQQGAIVLRDVTRFFPAGTIHVAVVDPGVGTDRQIVYAEIAGGHYLAPDNGLLSLLTREVQPRQLVAVTNRVYFRDEISHTFHGRDIFAPVAAHLSLGVDPALLGPAMDKLVSLSWPEPKPLDDGVEGEIVDVDHFGNLMTNIAEQSLASLPVPRQRWEIQVAGRVIVGLSRTYGERSADEVIALVGSSGYLEIAQVGGNAVQQLAARVGDAVRVQWPSG